MENKLSYIHEKYYRDMTLNWILYLLFGMKLFIMHKYLLTFIDIADSNKRMSDVLEEFEKDGKLSNYNTDGVRIKNLLSI